MVAYHETQEPADDPDLDLLDILYLLLLHVVLDQFLLLLHLLAVHFDAFLKITLQEVMPVLGSKRFFSFGQSVGRRLVHAIQVVFEDVCPHMYLLSLSQALFRQVSHVVHLFNFTNYLVF